MMDEISKSRKLWPVEQALHNELDKVLHILPAALIHVIRAYALAPGTGQAGMFVRQNQLLLCFPRNLLLQLALILSIAVSPLCCLKTS